MRLQVEDLAYSYGEKDAVDQVSLQVERGEFVGLIGPNGSGKSTVLKNIYRGLTPDRGSIKLDGENLMTMPYKKSALKGGSGRSGKLKFLLISWWKRSLPWEEALIRNCLMLTMSTIKRSYIMRWNTWGWHIWRREVI